MLAVPPLCRDADYSINAAENQKLIRHIESGGITTLLYGGNANFYHLPLSEYDDALSMLEQLAGAGRVGAPARFFQERAKMKRTNLASLPCRV